MNKNEKYFDHRLTADKRLGSYIASFKIAFLQTVWSATSFIRKSLGETAGFEKEKK